VFAGQLAMTQEKMDEWMDALEQTSICGLGQASPIPVRAALAHWPEEIAWSS
jgi:NADH:ubiquinone oxidoreductase subunit F (NADH-binding)